MKEKIKIIKKLIKKIIRTKCWKCKGRGCKVCNFTGKWEETIFYFLTHDKKGNQVCVDSDTIA